MSHNYQEDRIFLRNSTPYINNENLIVLDKFVPEEGFIYAMISSVNH